MKKIRAEELSSFYLRKFDETKNDLRPESFRAILWAQVK